MYSSLYQGKQFSPDGYTVLLLLYTMGRGIKWSSRDGALSDARSSTAVGACTTSLHPADLDLPLTPAT